LFVNFLQQLTKYNQLNFQQNLASKWNQEKQIPNNSK
jgi:hypothetical protein